jgi:hypothetical protein
LLICLHFVASREKFFADFTKTEGRSALVWLDEIIINQGNIEDSLKCLPVYLMACKKVLVLCGETYANRLWCIWCVFVFMNSHGLCVKLLMRLPRELYTLFAMSKYWDESMNRVEILDISEKGDVAEKLANFELSDASCYNPK